MGLDKTDQCFSEHLWATSTEKHEPNINALGLTGSFQSVQHFQRSDNWVLISRQLNISAFKMSFGALRMTMHATWTAVQLLFGF